MFNISIIQFAPVLGDPSQTRSNLDNLFRRIEGSDLVILPELANSGYNFTSSKQAFDSSEAIGESSFIDFLTNWANKKNCLVVSGMNERAGDRLYNSSVLLGKKGLIGRYRKTHLFMNEKDFFSPGDEGFPVFEVNGIKIGMLICFDYLFPEAWRIMALQGAQIICHPSNLVTPYGERVVPVQAIINRFFVATANRIGDEGNLSFRGNSLLADPLGDILAQAPENEESLIRVSIDPGKAHDKMITGRNHVLNDRRPDIYRGLL